jgi:hypothetical protein
MAVSIGLALCSAAVAYMPAFIIRECSHCRARVVDECLRLLSYQFGDGYDLAVGLIKSLAQEGVQGVRGFREENEAGRGIQGLSGLRR